MISTAVVKYVLRINRCQVRSTVHCITQLFAAVAN